MSADPHILRQSALDTGVSQQEASSADASRLEAKTAVRASADGQTSQIAHEEYVKLVQRVFFRPIGDAPQVVVFAGIDHGNGCTRICRKAAEVLAAASSGTVCLVDSDFYSSQSPQDGPEGSRLIESFAGGPVRTYVHEMETQNLWVLSRRDSGPVSSNPIAPDLLRTKLGVLRQEFSRVLIDAPPLNRHSEAVALAQMADGLIVVIEADATRREAARRVMETLNHAGVKVLGAVLNKRSFPIPATLYRQL